MVSIYIHLATLPDGGKPNLCVSLQGQSSGLAHTNCTSMILTITMCYIRIAPREISTGIIWNHSASRCLLLELRITTNTVSAEVQ